jgi:hypothetical protein
MIYQNRYGEPDKVQFLESVKQYSESNNWNPNWLMAVMKTESNLNPRAVNPTSNATGLIQFMPSTAISLGTTVAELKNMNGTQQMEYVKKYLRPYQSRIKSFYDLYLAVFYPAYLGKPDKTVFPDNVIAWNRGLFVYGNDIKAWKKRSLEIASGGDEKIKKEILKNPNDKIDTAIIVSLVVIAVVAVILMVL